MSLQEQGAVTVEHPAYFCTCSPSRASSEGLSTSCLERRYGLPLRMFCDTIHDRQDSPLKYAI